MVIVFVIPARRVPASLPNNARIVYFDVRKVRWCSVYGVAFHGSAWLRIAQDAKSIMRTLFADQCSWAGVFVVRGLCFCSRRSCHASSRVLETLLGHWSKTGRPYVVYKGGRADTGGGDLAPGRLDSTCRCSILPLHLGRIVKIGSVGLTQDERTEVGIIQVSFIQTFMT